VLGLWGWAQGPAQPSAGHAEQVQVLEGKLAKLEDAYRTVTAGRDQIRKKLADVEEQKEKLQKELSQLQATTSREIEELKAQVAARTSERDAALAQFDQFRRGLRGLLTQADAAAQSMGSGPSLTSSEPPEPGKF